MRIMSHDFKRGETQSVSVSVKVLHSYPKVYKVLADNLKRNKTTEWRSKVENEKKFKFHLSPSGMGLNFTCYIILI